MLKEFQKGNFNATRVPGKFNHLPSDEFIKQTVNRNQKAPGEIIEFLLPKESPAMYIDKQYCRQTDFTDGRFIATDQVRKCSERFSTITSELC